MTDLEKIFRDHTGNIIHKWDHYFGIYENHMGRFRNKAPVILEIGIYKGGSLEMWEKYFGSGTKIYGIDINPKCKRFEKENVKIFIGSQEDPLFLNKVKEEVGEVDILIDDGGHMMNQLRTSFEHLYDIVKDGGIYLAEDLHTCYWPAYDGGLGRRSNFMEYCKRLTDKLNEWHYCRNGVSGFTESTSSIHFYDSVVVFEKTSRKRPFALYAGLIDPSEIESEAPSSKNLWKKMKYYLHRFTGINIP